MRIVASQRTTELIESHGGRLYVWLKRSSCCSAATLRTSMRPPRGREFRQVDGADGFELFMPAHLTRFPSELELEARRFPDRVEAYWNGCAWVV